MHQMGNARNAFPLHAGSWAHQRAGGDKQHILQSSLPDFRQNKRAQNRCGTATSRATCVDVLLLSVID